MSDLTLVVVPTPLELERLRETAGALAATDRRLRFEPCGFGPLAAAARTAQLLAHARPARVVLAGIAGAYDEHRSPPGTACVFARVAVDGVGAGAGARFQGPAALGFPQWSGSPDTTVAPIVDELTLRVPDGLAAELRGELLLTVCAAAGDAAQASERRARFPEAVAEDMEGFGVALACALARVPLTIVRGISNRAGDRDKQRWQVGAALEAARRALAAVLAAR